MRWPGTIQPSRFLSHTGRVMPGVRRVVQVPQPGVGVGWSVVVPAGVMWYIIGGRFTIATSATVANRFATVSLTVEGLVVWAAAAQVAQPAGVSVTYVFASTTAVMTQSSDSFVSQVPFPDAPLPSGAVVSSGIADGQAGDQFSGMDMYIEEYYFTDAQLSEAARIGAELNREIAQYEFQQAEQAGG